MKELTKLQLNRIWKTRGLDPKVGWFYIQFKNKFEEECFIANINSQEAIKDLLNFLDNQKIKEVIFFPEPDFNLNGLPSGIIKTRDLEKFLKENEDKTTNTHIADKNLNWIFTITHEDDFLISGNKKLVKEFVCFFKNAKTTF